MRTTWLRSPLVQFVVTGAAIFVVYGLVRGSRVDESRRIEVSEQQIDRLREMLTAQWRRPPIESELAGLIQSYIREEILYREAIAMGLDQDDTVVRRLMAQKLELIADDLATYGVHLVQIHERTPSRSPQLSEVSDRVGNDLVNDRRREAGEALLESLKERYDIVVAGR